MAKKNKFKNFMLYGGVNQEEYEQIKPVISEANLKVWKVVSLALVILALVCNSCVHSFYLWQKTS